jgi:beta-glucosidase
MPRLTILPQCLLVVSLLVGSARGATPIFRDASKPVEARVDDLLAQLTLEEKIKLLNGSDGAGAVPRLGLPRIRMAGGPVGIRSSTIKATEYPASVALAASWDSSLAESFGVACARDARQRGIYIILGGGMNIQRVPQDSRNFEYYSEDPYLSGRIGVAMVRGTQSQGVAATIKHFAANNQETGRMSIDARISERALREIYLPAFRASVVEGHAWAVMSAYNRLNGTFCTENDWLNNTVLKGEWKFNGVLMSDWNATHDTLGAMRGGLDLEMPRGIFLNEKNLLPLLDSGQVTLPMIDGKVRRLLRLVIANGFLDRPQIDESIPAEDPRSREVALEIARRSVTLLKNSGGVLPLDSKKIKHLVVIGPNADQAPRGGGSSVIVPFHGVSLLDGIRKLAPRGLQVDGILENREADFERLAKLTHYEAPVEIVFNPSSTDKTVLARLTSDQISADWSGRSPAEGVPVQGFHAIWTTSIVPKESGPHTFLVKVHGGAVLKIDAKVLFGVSDQYDGILAAEAELEAGRKYSLMVNYVRRKPESSSVQLAWGPNHPPLAADDVDKIANADAVIVSAGFNSTSETEGTDRAYSLPTSQRRLIQAVTALNRRTIVVLNSGGSVQTAGWIDQVPALLEAYYPGQEGGRALAEILFGHVNPSGKLPFTWEKRWEDHPAFDNYPGDGREVDYDEGVFVGYRWYDHRNLEPRFPFGHGLSYTRFAYANLRVEPKSDGSGEVVTFDLKNVGERAGDEIAQLYVAPPPTVVSRPPRELKSFARVSLSPGETKHVSLELAHDDLAWFDEESHTWCTDAGLYHLEIGASSRDLRVRGEFRISRTAHHPPR